MDSNVDSPVVGRHDWIIHHTGKIVSVSGLTNDFGKPIMDEVVHHK